MFITTSTSPPIVLEFWEVAGQIAQFILVPVLFCGGLCVISNQVDGNNGVEIVEIKLIWVHHVADNEVVTTGYIYQAKKKSVSKSESKIYHQHYRRLLFGQLNNSTHFFVVNLETI